MGKPDATVLTVVWDAGESLATWLAHLEQQTFPAARFEVLVVDACGAHACCDMVRRYAAGAPMPIRCIRHEGSGLADARNLGMREALGRWLLFLNVDLLPGPGWVQAHVAAQESADGAACAAAPVARHPQLPGNLITRWFLPESWPHLAEEAPPSFLECSAQNLSLPRRALMDAGGFSGNFGHSGFDAMEMAWRLNRRKIPICSAAGATGFIWRGISFDAEYRRQYARGFALPALMAATDPAQVRRRFPVATNPFQQLADVLVMPHYLRACQQAQEDMRMVSAMFRRTLRYAFRSGFQDARKGREKKY